MESEHHIEVPPDTAVDGLSSLLIAIVNSSDDAIISKTLDGIITSWNPAAEAMFGYTAAEVVGQSIRIIIPSDRQDEEDFVLGKIRCGERVDHFETIRQTKDGQLLNISLTVSPVRNGSGTVVGVSKIARDITVRKRMERERGTTRAGTANTRTVGGGPRLARRIHRGGSARIAQSAQRIPAFAPDFAATRRRSVGGRQDAALHPEVPKSAQTHGVADRSITRRYEDSHRNIRTRARACGPWRSLTRSRRQVRVGWFRQANLPASTFADRR